LYRFRAGGAIRILQDRSAIASKRALTAAPSGWPAACDFSIGMNRAVPPIVMLIAIMLSSYARSFANEANDTHIRMLDARFAPRVATGVRGSPTFRDLVTRLNKSDVVVYVQCDQGLRPGLDGQTSFLAAAGGRRYVIVRMASSLSTYRFIATLGHELQHAVEIAGLSAVVDQQSLARAYEEIGYATAYTTPRARTFDSHGAVESGERIRTELNNSTAAD
jgi:hypothetical protein